MPVDLTQMQNLEGLQDFEVRWSWATGRTRPGFTAVLRVKNEAQSLPWVLPPLFETVAEVVLVDNGSDDGTPELAQALAREAGAADRFRLLHYPHAVARCGSEHRATPPTSVHSLAYFYNWCFSHVQTRYALKWDGDMVLSERGQRMLQDLSWQLENTEVTVNFPRSPLYVASESLAYLDLGLAQAESWGWPNTAGHHFIKAFNWEHAQKPDDEELVGLPNVVCFELKWLGSDEFSHWSDNSFEAGLKRKPREWEIYHAVSEGRVPDKVLVIEAAEGEHVIQTLRRTYPTLTVAP